MYLPNFTTRTALTRMAAADIAAQADLINKQRVLDGAKPATQEALIKGRYLPSVNQAVDHLLAKEPAVAKSPILPFRESLKLASLTMLSRQLRAVVRLKLDRINQVEYRASAQLDELDQLEVSGEYEDLQLGDW